MKKIKVLRIITRLNVGGPSIHTLLLTRYLDPERFENILVAGEVGVDEGDMGYLARELMVKPIYVRGLGREMSLLNDTRALFRLISIILRERPDIIHTHLPKAGVLGRIAGGIVKFVLIFRGKRIKIFHTFHGHFFYGYFGGMAVRFFKAIEKTLALICEKLIVISPTQREDIVDKHHLVPGKKVRVIPLGFDLSKITGVSGDGHRFREEIGVGGDEKLIGIVGRFNAIKNHRLFIEGAARYLGDERHYPVNSGAHRVKFVLVGDGELKEELFDYARRLGIGEDIIFAGWKKDMGEVYAALDVLALTSANEGTPVAIIEAMAARVPVVATAVGGVLDLLGEVGGWEERGQGGEWGGVEGDGAVFVAKRGILISPGDAEALSEGIEILLSDETMAEDIVKGGYEFVIRTYDKDRLMGDISALYLESLGMI